MNAEDDLKPKGTYDSPVRREQAEMTRQRIASAARTLFLRNGYAGTKLRQVAEQAEVSEQTIYSVYRNKSGLLLAIIDDMDMMAGVEQAAKDLAAAVGDAPRQLGVYVAFDRRLFTREGPTLRIMRDAGATEPEMARTYLDGRNRSRDIHLRTMQQWEEDGALHRSLTAEQAADIYHAVSSIDTYGYLVDERGWSPEEWERHTYRLLGGALLRGPGAGS